MVKKKSGGEADIQTAKSRTGKLDVSKKSRYPVFPSISYARKNKPYGTIFSTPKSGRIYVITRGTWGEKSSDKEVKGFPAGTPDNEIRAYAERTKVKHGPEEKPDTSKEKAKHGYATKKFKNLTKRKEPLD